MQRTLPHGAQRCLPTVRDRLIFLRDPFFTTVCIGEWVVKQPHVVTLADQAATPGRHRVAWTTRVSAFGACVCAPRSTQARSRRSRSVAKLPSFVGKDLKRRRTSTARPRSGKGVVDSRRKEVDLKKGARDEVGQQSFRARGRTQSFRFSFKSWWKGFECGGQKRCGRVLR